MQAPAIDPLSLELEPLPPKPKSNRGRRPTEKPAETKKQMLDRISQRQHRQKQQNYVAALEKRAEALASLVATERSLRAQAEAENYTLRCMLGIAHVSPSPGPHHHQYDPSTPVRPQQPQPSPEQQDSLYAQLVPPMDPAPPRASSSASTYSSYAESSESDLMDVQTAPFSHPPLPPNHVSSIADSTPSPNSQQTLDEWFDEVRRNSASTATLGTHPPDTILPKSATDLFGPPQVEWARYACKQVPCLKDCRHVDILFDIFLAQAKCSDVKLIEKYIVRIVSSWYKILDAMKDAPEADLRSIYHLDEVFKVINKDHMAYFYDVAANAATKLEIIKSTPRLSTATMSMNRVIDRASLRTAIKGIPSLQEGADALIEDLCEAYQTKRNFFKISVIIGQIQNKCANSDDRARFLSALHSWRIRNNELQDAAFDEVLSALDSVTIS